MPTEIYLERVVFRQNVLDPNTDTLEAVLNEARVLIEDGVKYQADTKTVYVAQFNRTEFEALSLALDEIKTKTKQRWEEFKQQPEPPQ